MKPEVFEVVKLALQLVLLILTVFIVPQVNGWLKANTTKERREEAKFWTSVAVQAAESIYKEKGQGAVKREWVLEWLNQNGIKITDDQAKVLIDMIVREFNRNGWNLPLN